MTTPNAENPTGAKTSPVVMILAILFAVFVVLFLARTCFGPMP